MKSYTDIEQSKKLAEILPFESSDMCYPPYYIGDEDGDHLYYSLPLLEYKEKCAYNRDNKDEYIPCWSLAALFKIMSNEVEIDGQCYAPCLFPVNGRWLYKLWYNSNYIITSPISIFKDNPVDACYKMIIKLHELNLL